MATRTQSSAWKLKFAMREIVQRVCGPADVKDMTVVNKDFPTTYLAAMHEITAAAFIADQVLPLLFPVSDDQGEFNYAAESGVASVCMIMSSMNVGLAWRYCWLSRVRSNILAEPPTKASRIKKFTVIMLALSSNLACCIWLIPNKGAPNMPPEVPVWTVRSIGTMVLCLYAIILYGAHMGNLLEALDSSKSEAINMKDKVFACIYGFFVILLLCAYVLPDSELLLQIVLVFWAVCLLLVYSFTPPELPLVTTIDLASADDVIEYRESLGQSLRNCNCPPFLVNSFSFIKLLSAPIEERLIWPRDYMSATHEVFGITLIITWVITLLIPALRPQIFEHPAKVIIGSYNPCFGWDYFPASWIAVYCCSFNCYFAYRYAWCASLRRVLLRGTGEMTWASTVSTMASYALALSSNLWVCLWVLGPNPEDKIGDDPGGPEIFWWSVHTALFVFMAGAEYATYVALLLDVGMSPRSEKVTTKQKVFAAVYGYCCAYLLFVYAWNLAFHDRGTGKPALGSGWWTQVSDIMWMASVISIQNFLPEEPPLSQKTEVPQISVPLDQEISE